MNKIFESLSIKTIFESTSEGEQIVLGNSYLFKELAENEGMDVSKFDLHIQENGNVSNYFICTYEVDGYKIRIANHTHNAKYDNDVVMDIIVKNIDPNFIMKKFNEFKENISNFEQREKTIEIINNSNLAINFVNNYSTNPTWFDKLCTKVGIDPNLKQYDWFKIALQNKCKEIGESNPDFLRKYNDTFLSLWKAGQRLKHF